MEACILVCRSHKSVDLKDKIIFINAIKEVTRKNAQSYLEDPHIENIVKAYIGRQDIDDFKRLVSHDEIIKNDYDLSVQKYIFLNESDNEYIDTDISAVEWQKAHNNLTASLEQLISLL